MSIDESAATQTKTNAEANKDLRVETDFQLFISLLLLMLTVQRTTRTA
jgi:hypothetical protein